MVQIIPIDAVIRLALAKTYELTALKNKLEVTPESIAAAIGYDVTSGFVTIALNQLAELGLVSTFQDSETGMRVRLTPSGAREAEQELRTPDSLAFKFQRFGDQAVSDVVVEIGQIPAAGRFVSRTHNASDFESLDASLTELEASLSAGNNEAGEIFGDDRVAIAEEVAALRALINSTKVRLTFALEMARRSLGWISEKAGAAAIGEIAKKALAFAISWLTS